MEQAIRYLREHENEHLGWVKDLCRIPSISTQDKHKDDVRRAVEWTRDLCEKLGFKTQIDDTERHPILYAEWCQAAEAPTYLAYGHVDVQPEGDRELWDADPFAPYVKDGWLYGRGAADNKGPLLIYLRAAQTWLETHGRLPVNLKLLIEGEEEIGSPNLGPFVEEQRDLLKCDGILISDTGLFKDGWPTITTGTRGIVYKEIWLSGPEHDLHSGDGGPVTNPANTLARIIASLHDEKGRVNIPGFYDNVLEPSAEQRAQLAQLPFDETEFAEQLGVPGFAGGEEGWSIRELMTLRPTLDVNGICGGYTDHGASTIIPATAGAKISMRIVPNQSGRDIGRKFDEAVRARCPQTVRCEILDHACAEPYVTPLEGGALTEAERALREAFDHGVAFVGCGGTLPILPMFKQHLNADSMLIGFASPQCNAHGPNEKVNLADLDRGAEAVVRLLAYLAE
jgi:acetylornithine deacetylase/succinyl-diaminopimelate desuccinylase-like protein